MTMSTWVIVSWVFVGLLTGLNIFIFIKLKNASLQLMQMAFPGTKNMAEAVQKMQGMMGAMKGMGGLGGMGGARGNPNMQAQMNQAMAMLQNMPRGNKGKGPRR